MVSKEDLRRRRELARNNPRYVSNFGPKSRVEPIGYTNPDEMITWTLSKADSNIKTGNYDSAFKELDSALTEISKHGGDIDAHKYVAAVDRREKRLVKEMKKQKYIFSEQQSRLVKLKIKLDELKHNTPTRNESGLAGKVAGIISLISFAGCFIFLSPEITANVVGASNVGSSGWPALIFLFIGMAGAFAYFKNRGN